MVTILWLEYDTLCEEHPVDYSIYWYLTIVKKAL